MRVNVLFFGVLREAFGSAEQTVDLPGETCSVGDLLARLREQTGPGTQALWPRLAVAVNLAYAAATDPLHPGDEVALLPPVSGGAAGDPDTDPNTDPQGGRALLTHAPLRADAVAVLKDGADGAVVVFDGIVRNNTRGRITQYLVYEAYEAMALARMHALLAEARERFPVRDVLLHHRLGRLEIGETSVLIAVASAHRAAAFDACRWLIDTLKQTVPIWKREHFLDGAVWADGEPFPAALHPIREDFEP